MGLSEKQQVAFQGSNKRLNIFHGSTRGGKTFISLLRFVTWIYETEPRYTVFLVGKSRTTLKRNIIEPLQKMFGTCIHFLESKNELFIGRYKVDVVGASDSYSEGRIRGATAQGAYIDELTLLPQNFFNMLLSRMSVENAKIFATTNPDALGHWVYKEIIERQEELDCSIFHFTLDDNPSLSESYKENLKKEYALSPLFYKRFITGEWCSAENSIYSLDRGLHTIICPPTAHAAHYFAGIDVGTTNPTAAVIIGQDKNSYPNMWVEKEYYYSSLKTGVKKSDFELVQDLKHFFSFYELEAIYVDPAALSLQEEMRRQHISHIYKASNDVINGIHYVSKLLSSGTLKIVRHCENLLNELENYVWDSKASLKGIDRPLKVNDHAADALRYALFSHCFGKETEVGMSKEQVRLYERRWNYGF